MDTARFPAEFLWGTATSSHQVEGNNRNNDWWEWEHKPGRIRDGQTSGEAARWWNGGAEEDLAWAAGAGQNAHRLSLEWSRLEPAAGRFDDSAFERYREVLLHARKLKLKTIVTLNHFTLPTWAAQEGSWLNRDLAHRLARFARRCGQELGELVTHWATLNEPNVLAFFAYAGTRWPPGLGKRPAFATALAHMLQAHAMASRALHDVSDASVGLVLNLPRFVPARPKRRDRYVARAQDWAMNGVLLRALETGRLLPPAGWVPAAVDGLVGSFDWLGLNYYGSFDVRFDPRVPADLFGRHVQDPTICTEWTDWGKPDPQGLTAQLVRLARFGVPIIVTENGVFDNEDTRRPEYMLSHVRAVHQAIERGVDVRGYFFWSLVDNFEWAEGWSTHFGLLALDRKTGVRTPRPSAALFEKICTTNAVPLADATPIGPRLL